MSEKNNEQIEGRVGKGYTTEDYRNAVNGVGPIAYQWQDKPHRLVYDLCTQMEETEAKLSIEQDIVAALQESLKSLQVVADRRASEIAGHKLYLQSAQKDGDRLAEIEAMLRTALHLLRNACLYDLVASGEWRDRTSELLSSPTALEVMGYE